MITLSTFLLPSFLLDPNWQQAMTFAPWPSSAIAELLHTDPGEPDGSSWLAVVLLHDGTHGFLEAGCGPDWGTDAGGEGFTAPDLPTLKRHHMNTNHRRRLGLIITGRDDIIQPIAP